MCNSTVHNRPPPSTFNGIVDPFSFSTFHLLSTCNRLMLPTDLQNYYSLVKDNSSTADDQNRIEPTRKSDLQYAEIKTVFPPTMTGSKELHQTLPAAISISANPSCSSLDTDYSHREYPLNEINRIGSYANFLSRRQRGEKRPIPDEQKDEKYYERRKRNNEAAKKSRDARKIREDRIAFRASLLEQENAILRAQSIALREEIARLRQIMSTSVQI